MNKVISALLFYCTFLMVGKARYTPEKSNLLYDNKTNFETSK